MLNIKSPMLYCKYDERTRLQQIEISVASFNAKVYGIFHLLFLSFCFIFFFTTILRKRLHRIRIFFIVHLSTNLIERVYSLLDYCNYSEKRWSSSVITGQCLLLQRCSIFCDILEIYSAMLDENQLDCFRASDKSNH